MFLPGLQVRGKTENIAKCTNCLAVYPGLYSRIHGCMDAKLEDDLAELYDFDPRVNAIAKIASIEQELLNIVCLPCFTMIFGCILTILIRVAVLRRITSTPRARLWSSPRTRS